MVQADIDRLSRLMLAEFGRVHEHLDKHDERFDDIDSEVRGVRAELKSIRAEVDDLQEKVDNLTGYRREIDHALERIATIERRLGIDKQVA